MGRELCVVACLGEYNVFMGMEVKGVLPQCHPLFLRESFTEPGTHQLAMLTN